MRHGSREGVNFHCALAQRCQARKALRIDVIAKDNHRRPLITNDRHDIGLAELVVHEPAVSGLRLEKLQPDNRLLGEALDCGLQAIILGAHAFFVAGLSVEQNLKSTRAATGRKVDKLMQVLRSL